MSVAFIVTAPNINTKDTNDALSKDWWFNIGERRADQERRLLSSMDGRLGGCRISLTAVNL